MGTIEGYEATSSTLNDVSIENDSTIVAAEAADETGGDALGPAAAESTAAAAAVVPSSECARNNRGNGRDLLGLNSGNRWVVRRSSRTGNPFTFCSH